MARFQLNPSLERELLRDRRVVAGVRARAELVARLAESYARTAGAPWMPRRSGRIMQVSPSPRGGMIVANTDYAAHLIEWGSRNNPPHAPLRRAARAVGLELIEAGAP